MTVVEPSSFETRRVRLSDAEAQPLLHELAYEYATRYGTDEELGSAVDADFAPPSGLLVVLVENDVVVAGGGFRRYDDRTAELKRMWTHSAHRRRGLARLVITELEREAADQGYLRSYLTTGPRQPEARALYLKAGYRPLFDVHSDPELIGVLAFEKDLRPGSA
ncbi:GNAT family N-acetyltransferase [Actinosynnema sp. NPDC020468]|uniref:GNAT family N-acetyltransferase n=1 Tax=Actinosynnema sp. NPDC020468 TaxID=3154488 RepID=UPI0033CE6567